MFQLITQLVLRRDLDHTSGFKITENLQDISWRASSHQVERICGFPIDRIFVLVELNILVLRDGHIVQYTHQAGPVTQQQH